MADPFSVLSITSTLMSVAGAFSQASGMKSAAKHNERRAAAEKVQLDYMAGQEQASGQHAAVAARRKAALMASRYKALEAASGGKGDGSIMEGILDEGEREAGFKMYESGERANTLKYKGAVGLQDASYQRKFAGQQANMTILGALAKAGPSMSSMFAPEVPPGVSNGSEYDGTWTSEGPFDSRTYTKRYSD